MGNPKRRASALAALLAIGGSAPFAVAQTTAPVTTSPAVAVPMATMPQYVGGGFQQRVEYVAARPPAASVVLQIDRSDPNRSDRGASAQVVAAICRSTAVVDPALQAAFNVPPAEARPLATVDAQPLSEAFLTLSITLNDPAGKLAPDAGQKLIDEILDRATAALARSSEAQSASVRNRRADLERRVAEAEKYSATLDAEYGRAAPNFDGSGYSRQNNRSNYEQQRASLNVQLAGQRARLAAMERVARDAASQPAQPAAETADPRLGDTGASLVAAREQEVAAVDRNDAKALAAAQANLAEARLLARVAERVIPTTIRRPPTGGFDQTASIRTQVADYEAQIAVLDANLAALGGSTTQPTMTQNDFSMLSNERSNARERLRQARQELDQFDRTNAVQRAPAITKLSGNG